MQERAYRQRLDADLSRWQADGLITPVIADAIRNTLRPVPEGITIAGVVAIVGGLLIAAAFLAFVASNWTEIARPARFAILIAGIVAAYALGAWFDRNGRTYVADLCAGVGSIIFGAAIALTGQMYHLAADFAAGMLLFAAGSLAAATLAGSRGALAVALVAACVWNHMRVVEYDAVHLAFVPFWAIAAYLAVAWNAPVARHLVAVAALAWLISVGFALDGSRYADPVFAVSVGNALLVGVGLAFASRGSESVVAFGQTLSHYGAIALALVLTLVIARVFGRSALIPPTTLLALAALAAVLPFVAGAPGRRAGPALAGFAIVLALAVVSGTIPRTSGDEPWLLYALALASMLCLVISGLIDEMRPRVVAGWIGLASLIAAITWEVQGSHLRRSVFLAAAGVVAVALASFLGRIMRKERAR
jgi:uncharacterized membrane protein